MANSTEDCIIILDDETSAPQSHKKMQKHTPVKMRKLVGFPICNISVTPRRRSARVQANLIKKHLNGLNIFKGNQQSKRGINSSILNSPSNDKWNSKSYDRDIIIIEDEIIVIDDDNSETEDHNIKDNIEIDKPNSNIYSLKPAINEGLREIVIDGSSIALGCTGGLSFSVEGIKQAIDYFLNRGHKVKAFVPHYRLKFKNSSNQKLLESLVKKNYVITTPSRLVKGNLISSHDGRYILQYATYCQGIVVSHSGFEDIICENIEWRKTVELRLLVPTWNDNKIEFKNKPIGNFGLDLNSFLKFS